MDISKLDKNSIKIKGKTASVVFDPDGKIDADIVIVTVPESLRLLDKANEVRLIISGPGEYEAGGISISGKNLKGSVYYTLTEGSRILFIDSQSLQNFSDDDEFDCCVVHVNGPFSDDQLGPINAKCVVLYGDTEGAKVTSGAVEKVSKINLKKTSEIQGKKFLFE